MEKLLFDLCSAHGVSGDEIDAHNVAKKELSKYARTYIDNSKNLICVMGNENSAKHIMLNAHMDQVGIIITYIDDDGFVFFNTCGGMDANALIGAKVTLLGKQEVSGIISFSPKACISKNHSSAPKIEDLNIDTGLSADKVKELLSPGDRAVICNDQKKLISGRIAAKALDNRSGVACVIECARLLSKQKLNCKVSIVCTSQEETTALGATTSAYLLQPDEAIVLDVSFGNQPGLPDEKTKKLSSGAIIGKSPIISNDIANRLISLAESNCIPHTLEIMAGNTGTDADSISISRGSIKTGLISIPQRYMHSPLEVVDIKDLENISKLLMLYVIDYDKR
jgi:endoglucanase